MRIIGGNFKGKKIFEPKDKETRPLKDLTKESIFNLIIHSNKFKVDLKNSYILDLFSGDGSFGLECLSRGVKKITFVEVGVFGGGSLFMWINFFGKQARIIGIELNPEAKKWEKDGFEIFIGDQSDPDFWTDFWVLGFFGGGVLWLALSCLFFGYFIYI